MNIEDAIRQEWSSTHALSRQSCHWLAEHNPDLAQPIPQALLELRSPVASPASNCTTPGLENPSFTSPSAPSAGPS